MKRSALTDLEQPVAFPRFTTMALLSQHPTRSNPSERLGSDRRRLNQSDVSDSLFDDIYRSEWEHRRKVENELALAHQALLEAVLFIAPIVVNDRIEKRPRFLERLEIQDWMALLREAKQLGLGWWATASQQELQMEIQRLEKETAELSKSLRTVQGNRQDLQNRFDLLEDEHSLWLQARQPLPILTAHTVSLPVPPDQPPPEYASSFPHADTWQRSCLLISLLALTGWSQTMAVTKILAEVIDVAVTSGTITRLLKRLTKAGLIVRHSLSIPTGIITVIYLSDEGRRLVISLGIQPVESEWKRLQRLMKGAPQERLALICQFAANARQRGYATQVAPETPHMDGVVDALLIDSKGERIYIIVEDRSSTQRLKVWRQVARQQKFLALCATTPKTAQALLETAREDGMSGMITDLDTLRDLKHRSLWSQKWSLRSQD